MLAIVLALLMQSNGFTYFVTSDFSFSPTCIHGRTSGTCHQKCGPWGSESTVVVSSFDAPVQDYRHTISCAAEDCKTVDTGDFESGTFGAIIAVGNESYLLKDIKFKGSFYSSNCLSGCNRDKSETYMTVDFSGVLEGVLPVEGTLQLVCLGENGCHPGDGLGTVAVME